jgi:hypothetical protein
VLARGSGRALAGQAGRSLRAVALGQTMRRGSPGQDDGDRLRS